MASWNSVIGVAAQPVINKYYNTNKSKEANKAVAAINFETGLNPISYATEKGLVKEPLGLQYPIDIDTNQDHLVISRYKYERAKGISANKSKPSENPIKDITSGGIIKVVVLPMPKVSDSNGAQWGKSDLDFLGMAALTVLKPSITGVDDGGNAVDTENAATGVFGKIQRTKNERDRFLRGEDKRTGIDSFMDYGSATMAMSGSMAMSSLGMTVSTDEILARTSGQILNPNAELLFQGPSLRQFSFSYLMVARGRQEGKQIRGIINNFKSGMAPKHGGGDKAPLLTTPDIWQLEYKKGRKKLTTVNKFLPMALQNMTVDYAPDGFWTAYEDSQPIAVKVNLTFGELKPLYDKDYEDGSNEVGY